jgi:purine-binding chemotaxis protein CheW
MPLNERIAVSGDEELELTPDQVRHVLQDRARKLAQAYAETLETAAASVQLITFTRSAHRYAIPLAYLTEIRPLASWTPVPGIPDFYEGVIQVRGEIIPLVDIVTLFESRREEPSAGAAEPFAVVLATDTAMLALLADSVDDVHDVRPDRIHPPLATFTNTRGRFIKSIIEDGPTIIDVEKLLGDKRLWVRHETND